MYSVDEVSSFSRPSWRNFLCLNLHLLTQYLISNFSSIPSVIRPPAQHQLVGNNTNSIVINRKRMILPAHHLWSHITWSSTCIATVIGLHDTSNPQISHPQIPTFIKNQVLRLDIAMDNIVEMQVLQTQ